MRMNVTWQFPPELLRSKFTDSKVDQNRTSYKLGNQQQNGEFKQHFDCAYPKNMLTININKTEILYVNMKNHG